MGLLKMMGRLLNTNQDGIARGAANEEDSDTELPNFEDMGYERIPRTIKNARWAYENDSTVNSSINNAVITANHDLRIATDDPKQFQKAKEYIEECSKQWKLNEFIDEAIEKCLVDGACFIQKSIRNGKLCLDFLAYDGDEFDFLIIRDPKTDEVLEYIQKATVLVPSDGWQNADFDDIQMEEEEVTYHFAPEEIIHLKYMEKDGDGRSAIYAALDLIDMKKRTEKYLIKSAHKSGAIMGLEIGADDYDISEVSDSDIEKIISWFSESDEKEVVGYPAGIKPTRMGANSLLDYTLYLKYFKTEIRSVLMTPDSKFESSKGGRFTTKEQMSGSAGFLVYMEYLRAFIKSWLEPDIINEALTIGRMENAIGHIFGEYPDLDKDDEAESANIANTLVSIVPGLDKDFILKGYFSRYQELVDANPNKTPNILEPAMQLQAKVNMNADPNETRGKPAQPGNEESQKTQRLQNTEDDPIILALRKRGWKGVKGTVS